MLNISEYKDEIEEVSKKLFVSRIDIFGSALTDRFNDKSDIDLIVAFDESKVSNMFEQYFTLKEQLERVFHRSVDVVIDGSVRNPIFKQEINATRRTVYVA